jgi:hypothetical protein
MESRQYMLTSAKRGATPKERHPGIAICLSLLLSSVSLFGQSFPQTWVNLGLGHGSRALAMSGAFVAVADDISAVCYNPAGLAQLSRPEFQLSAAFSGQTYQAPGFADERVSYSSRDYGFADRSFDFFGVAAPVTIGRRAIVAGLSYRREFSYNASYSYVLEHSSVFGYPSPEGHNEFVFEHDIDNHGGVDIVTLSLATRIVKGLYFGINTNVWSGQAGLHFLAQESGIRFEDGLEIRRWSGLTNEDSVHDLKTALGWDLGILWKISVFSVGLTVRPKFRIGYKERSFYEHRVVYSDGFESEYMESYEFRSAHEGPSGVSFGISVRPTNNMTFACDYSSLETESVITYYENRTIRAGCEYKAKVKKLSIPLRAGGFLKWGRPEYGSPRQKVFPGFTFGTGLQTGSLGLDLAVFYHSWRVDHADYLQVPPTRMPSWGLSLSIKSSLGRASRRS